MARQLLSKGQIRRAVIRLRQIVRDTEVTPLLDELERGMQHDYESWLPIVYRQPRSKNGRFTINYNLTPVSQATRGYYRPCGMRVLSRDHGVGLDEFSDVRGGSGSGMDQAAAAQELADRLETSRSLRGRGGRYGMISRGLGSFYAGMFGGQDLEWWLAGTAEEATAKIAKELRSLMLRPPESQELKLARQEAWQLLEEQGNDRAWYELARSYAWFDQPATQLLDLLVAYADLNWSHVATVKLGLVPNPRPRARRQPQAAPAARPPISLPRQRGATAPVAA